MNLRFQLVHGALDAAFVNLWQARVSAAELSLDLGYLRLLAQTSPDAEHHHVACVDDDGRLRGLAYVSLNRQRVAGVLPLRVLVLGGRVAGGQAFWFDEAAFGFNAFMTALRAFLAAAIPHDLLVLKEFSAGRDAAALVQNEAAGFVNVMCFHRSRIPLQQARSLDAYLDTLSSKRRYHLRQVLRGEREQGLEVEVVAHFAHLVDELYPLYLAVNARAQEAKTQPLPKALFEGLARELDSARVLLVRQGGQIRGFGLLLHQGNQVKCLVIGQDYAVARELNLWYAIVLHSIAYAASQGCDTVDLGSTNQDMKRKFGAVSDEIWISVRHRSDAWQRLLAPYIRFSLQRMYAPRGAPAVHQK